MAIMCTEFVIYDVLCFLYTQKYTDYPSTNQTMFVSWCSLCGSKCFTHKKKQKNKLRKIKKDSLLKVIINT